MTPAIPHVCVHCGGYASSDIGSLPMHLVCAEQAQILQEGVHVTPAIRASQIPVPARDGRCSVCGCRWADEVGRPNLRDVLCDGPCPCHNSWFAAAIYGEDGE